jgi:hypothetical protein
VVNGDWVVTAATPNPDTVMPTLHSPAKAHSLKGAETIAPAWGTSGLPKTPGRS